MARYGCTITVDTGKIPSSQSNFSWLATEDNFPTAAIDGGGTSILNGGGNLRCYTDDTKTTQLPIEVVTFVTGGTPSVIVWGLSGTLAVGSTVYIEADTVAVTQPAVTDTYGRNAVWVDFELVVHMGTVVDSTGNHAPFFPTSTPSKSSMLWGEGYDIQSSSERIEVADSSGLDFNSSIYLQIWSNTTTFSAVKGLFIKSDSNTSGYRVFKEVSGDLRLRHPELSTANLNTPESAGVVRNGFYYDGANRRITENATSKTTDSVTGTVTSNTDNLIIGSNANAFDPLDGILGEVWASSTLSYSADGETSEYNNQSSPSTFWAVGAWTDQDAGGGISITSNYYNILMAGN